MIQLRWLCATEDDPAPVLQWRVLQGYMNAVGLWSDWRTAPCAIRHAGGGAYWVRTAAHPNDVPHVVREGEDRHEPPAPPAPPPPRLIKEDVPLFPMNEGEQT